MLINGLIRRRCDCQCSHISRLCLSPPTSLVLRGGRLPHLPLIHTPYALRSVLLISAIVIFIRWPDSLPLSLVVLAAQTSVHSIPLLFLANNDAPSSHLSMFTHSFSHCLCRLCYTSHSDQSRSQNSRSRSAITPC